MTTACLEVSDVINSEAAAAGPSSGAPDTPSGLDQAVCGSSSVQSGAATTSAAKEQIVGIFNLRDFSVTRNMDLTFIAFLVWQE
jgi:hypothetical protein